MGGVKYIKSLSIAIYTPDLLKPKDRQTNGVFQFIYEVQEAELTRANHTLLSQISNLPLALSEVL